MKASHCLTCEMGFCVCIMSAVAASSRVLALSFLAMSSNIPAKASISMHIRVLSFCRNRANSTLPSDLWENPHPSDRILKAEQWMRYGQVSHRAKSASSCQVYSNLLAVLPLAAPSQE